MPKEDVKIVITTQPKGPGAATVTIGQKTKLSADMDNGDFSFYGIMVLVTKIKILYMYDRSGIYSCTCS